MLELAPLNKEKQGPIILKVAADDSLPQSEAQF